MQAFNVPILFLIFNRPAQTQKVFDAIRTIKPQYLYVAADGAREGNDNDIQNSAACKTIVKKIDWDCKVEYLFRENNLGCKDAVSSGITWFFENVEQGIILEDDCLPNENFFSFCEELLSKYKDDERVMHIGASCFQLGVQRGDGSYYFSRYPHIWGWASWRRAWKKFNISLDDYPVLIQQKEFLNFIDNKSIYETYLGNLDTWDSQWQVSIYRNNGLCILPNKVHLVKNIGFDDVNATNTTKTPKWFKRIKYGEIKHIVHPSRIELNNEADLFTRNYIYYTKGNYMGRKLFRYLPFWLFKFFSRSKKLKAWLSLSL